MTRTSEVMLHLTTQLVIAAAICAVLAIGWMAVN